MKEKQQKLLQYLGKKMIKSKSKRSSKLVIKKSIKNLNEEEYTGENYFLSDALMDSQYHYFDISVEDIIELYSDRIKLALALTSEDKDIRSLAAAIVKIINKKVGTIV